MISSRHMQTLYVWKFESMDYFHFDTFLPIPQCKFLLYSFSLKIYNSHYNRKHNKGILMQTAFTFDFLNQNSNFDYPVIRKYVKTIIFQVDVWCWVAWMNHIECILRVYRAHFSKTASIKIHSFFHLVFRRKHFQSCSQ